MWIILPIYIESSRMPIRIFAGAILHDALSLSINILGILRVFRAENGQKRALGLCHNSAIYRKHTRQFRQQ